MNSAHVSRLCSFRFCKPMLAANMPSIVPRSCLKPACSSIPSSSITICILRTSNEEKILDATSRRHIPRQFLHNERSPFFGSSTNLATSHSAYRSPCESSAIGPGSARPRKSAGSNTSTNPRSQSHPRSAREHPHPIAASAVVQCL